MSRILENCWLGEYVGKYYPLQMKETNGDADFTFDVDGTYKFKADAYQSPIATLAGGHLGNWTRFVNHSERPNIAFTTELLSNKQRIILIPERAFRLGRRSWGVMGRSTLMMM